MSIILKEKNLSIFRTSTTTIDITPNIRTFKFNPRQSSSNHLEIINDEATTNTLPIIIYNEESERRNKKQNNLSSKHSEKRYINFHRKLLKNVETIKVIRNHMQSNNDLLMTEEEFTKAYQQIKQDVTNNKTIVDSPVAIILGGQPGAGKSNIYQIARKRFSNNLVELDCDSFRVYHPYYEQIKIMFGKEDGAKTNPFIFKAVDMLVEELSSLKYNLIIESSLKSPKTAINNGKMLPAKGYNVELHIMATNKEVSWQSTINRYYEEIKRTGKPRAVPRDFHDKVISNICNSLYTVKQSGLMSNILMFDRKQNCLYDMKKDINVDPSILLDEIINGKVDLLRENDERLFETSKVLQC